MSAVKSLLRSEWIAPMDRPILRGAAVVFADGWIIDLGDARTMAQAHPDASVHDLGEAILLPGLINAHTHLELSTCSVADRPASFVEWILGIREQLKQTGLDEVPRVQLATRAGIEQCLRFGVTCVGDISQNSHASRPMIAKSPLRCVSYGEALGLGLLREQYERLLARALDRAAERDRVRIGLSPHAPYTVDLDGYRECIRLARQHNLPLATHLAETADERPFLEHRAGPFREMWDALGMWRDEVPTYRGSPVAFAREVGLLDEPTLLAHVNYCDDHELAMLARGRASVAYCPRTHAYFGHPPHRWREMLVAGINVAVGTDSCASSPDLNIIEELRLLHRIAPDVDMETLWQMATIRAARAIRMDHAIGSITPGKAADFVAFPARGDQPLVEILETQGTPTAVWIGGLEAT